MGGSINAEPVFHAYIIGRLVLATPVMPVVVSVLLVSAPVPGFSELTDALLPASEVPVAPSFKSTSALSLL